MDIELQYRKVRNVEHYGDAQLRFDLFREKWVLVSRSRGKRPSDFAPATHDAYDESSDVFSDEKISDQLPDTLIYKDPEGEWTTRVFPNMFPIVDQAIDIADISQGPYPAMNAIGVHEVVVTRDGHRSFALLETPELAEVIDAYQERYLTLMREKHVRSITIFHNHGAKAGGSLAHPHSQIMTLPVVASTVLHEVLVSERYRKQSGMHLFGMIARHEKETKERLVYENDRFIVYCPFASRRAFEMRVLPKMPQPYFERITDDEKLALADALGTALDALHKGLDDPDYNYYIRTAPCNGQSYRDFSYYVEVLPRTHVYAGFEAATDIDVVPISPEDAAAYLREIIEE